MQATPDYLSAVFSVEASALEKYVFAGSRVLNIGAGTGGGINFVNHQAKSIVHLDIDIKSLQEIKPDMVNSLICADTYRLPFKNGSFDVIICDWVVEHLEDPEAAVRQFVSVLKEQGKVLILTPNIFSIFSMVSLFMPYWLKRILRRKAFSEDFEKPHRVYYRLNSIGRANAVFAKYNCVLVFFKRIGAMFVYFRPRSLLYWLSVWYEKINNFILFRWNKMYLYLVYEKKP